MLPLPPLRPRRAIAGLSAVLLPLRGGKLALDDFAQLLATTFAAGLTPAVNMDTGYANFLSASEKISVLALTQEMAAGRPFVAGAYIEGERGELDALSAAAVDEIVAHGGTPILFPSTLLKRESEAGVVAFHRRIGERCPAFLGFELGEMFLSFGRIYEVETFRRLLEIPSLLGLKHSSLDREQEWQRLALRDAERPDFRVYTGNDLAIDMVMYGSDYLLGLSAFHPAAFALRDRLWALGDPGFYMLNDLLQYLGFFAFRTPVAAYKHTAAQFLHLRGAIATHETHPLAISRPESDLPILRDLADRIDALCAALQPRLNVEAK